MTKQEKTFRAIVKIMAKEASQSIISQAGGYLTAGALDLSGEHTPAELAKAAVYAAMYDVRTGYRPFSPELREVADNCTHF